MSALTSRQRWRRAKTLTERALLGIAEGRVSLILVDLQGPAPVVHARCRSSSGEGWYDIRFESGEWRCSCAGHSFAKRCWHSSAVALVCPADRTRPSGFDG
jgi:hypothetical protein